MEGKHASQHSNRNSARPARSAAFPNLDETSVMPGVKNARMSDDFDLGAQNVRAMRHAVPQRGGWNAQPAGSYPGGKAPMGTPGSQKASRGLKRNPVAIVAIVLVALLLVVYIAGAIMFSTHFYPHTTIGKFDVSMASFDDAAAQIDSAEKSYALAISGEGFKANVTAAEGGMQIDSAKVIAAAKADMNPALWFVNAWRSHDESEHLAASADSTALRQTVTAAVDEFNATQTASQDAAIVYDAAKRTYAVQPEVNGGQLDAETIVQQAITAMLGMQDSVTVPEEAVIKPQVLSSDARLVSGAEAANKMVACDVTLVAQISNSTKEITEVNGDNISQWITFDENYAPVFDETAMGTWANSLASSLNTVGTTRTFTRGDGKQVSVSGGDYGWAVDSSSLISAVENAISSGTQGQVAVQCSQTGNGFTSNGMDWGAYCDVDLTEQHARYYDASGNLLWESGIVSGKPDDENATPTGIYYLKTHQSPSMLRGPKKDNGEYEWESEVQYWMPFVGNLVGLHDASWQPSSVFGDPEAYKTYGSHGCVNLPTDKAAEIYGIIQNGDPVIVHW